MPNVEAFLTEAAEVVDRRLDELLPPESAEPVRLHRAIRWSTFAGGKRFRPALVIAVGRAFGARDELLLSTAAAVEMIHTFSLIHDDLPSMDDDDMRRGKATCHKEFGEATAILAGDALQTLAFKSLSTDPLLPPAVRLELVSSLASATGTPDGMVAGQQLDLEAEGSGSETVEIERIHSLKTGALISFSACAGAKIADAGEDDFASIEKFAASVGLLFQITDDLLDVSQSSETLGKTAGKDAAAKKMTYPSKYGYDGARSIAKSVLADAESALLPLGSRAETLRELARYIFSRSA
jgi:geranylgeranyl pyrophosphate synthase